MIQAKALVITGTQGNRQFHVATDTFAPRDFAQVAPIDSAQVVIVSECLHSMCAADMSEVKLRITEILNPQGEWDRQRERLRDLFAPYELRHKKEVTTLLELGLWKAKMVSEGVNPEIRGECRVNCGAMVIISNVLSFF
jgi:hypothetical protein